MQAINLSSRFNTGSAKVDRAMLPCKVHWGDAVQKQQAQLLSRAACYALWTSPTALAHAARYR